MELVTDTIFEIEVTKIRDGRKFTTLTKTKGAFPNDNSLLKLLFAGIKNALNL